MTALTDSFAIQQKPVVLIDLFFDSGTIRVWTRPFEGEFEGETYQPLAGITGALAVRQSLDQSSLDIAAQITGTADEIRAAGLTEEFQCRDAQVRLGNVNAAGDIEAAEIMILGTMQDIPIVEDESGGDVAIKIDSVFAEIDRPRDLRLSDADQARFNPDDTFFNFVDTVGTGERFGA